MKKLITTIGLLFALVVFTAPASAATYYISTDGDDGHVCSTTDSAGTNRSTWTGGIGCLSSGDTLVIHGGTYTVTAPVIIPSSKSGSAPSTYTTIQIAAGEVATLFCAVGGCNTDNSGIIQIGDVGGTASYIKLEGSITQKSFVVDGHNNIGNVGIYAGIAGTNHIWFRGIEVGWNGYNYGQPQTGSAGQNMQCLHGGGTDSLIQYSRFHHCSNGAYTGGDGQVWEYNEFDNNWQSGLHFGSQPCNSGRVTVRFNTMHDNGQSGWQDYHNQFLLGNAPPPLYGAGTSEYGHGIGFHACAGIAHNNFIWHNFSGGIFSNYGDGIFPQYLYNNTVIDNKSGLGSADVYIGGIGCDTGANQCIIRNNISCNNQVAQITNNSPSGITNTNLETCPAFVDAANKNYHLTAASAGALNAGVSLSTDFTVDFDGDTRPQGSAWDIGADEFLDTGGAGGGVIAFDSATFGNNSGNTVTISHTVATNNNRLSILAAAWDNTGSVTLNTVTYNGVAATQVCSTTINTISMKQYRLIAPDTGTHNAVFTFSGTPSMNRAGASIQTYYNVNQTTGTRTSQAATGNGTSVSNTVTTVANDWVTELMVAFETIATPTASQVVDTSNDNNFGIHYATHKTATTTSTNVTWTVDQAGRDWANCATPLIPSAQASTVSPIPVLSRRR